MSSLKTRRHLIIASALLLPLIFLAVAAEPDHAISDIKNSIQFHRPVALVAGSDRLFAANSRAGSICVIDPATLSVTGEYHLAQRLSDLALVPRTGQLLALDELAGQLIAIDRRGDSLSAASRLDVGFSPVRVIVSADSQWCAVSLLWAHQVAIVELGGGNMRLTHTVDLPFAPRTQCLLPDGKSLVIADSFGQELAILDVPGAAVRSIRSVEGHNIRGLAMSADAKQLLISHPILTQTLSTTESNIFWGSVMGNALRAVELPTLLNLPPAAERAGSDEAGASIGHWSLYSLGEQGKGAGDPGAVAVAKDGSVLVALSGADEVAIGQLRTGSFSRIAVGRRPTAIALSPDDRTAYVANTLDDSISVIDPAMSRVVGTVHLGKSPTASDVDAGERLFYSAQLSKDGWYSCSTCHTDGYSCGLKNDNFSDGSYGTPKRILSLGGTAHTGPWAWNASNPTLEEQIRHSILSTMAGKPERASEANVRAIAAFVRTLPPAPSLARARGRIDSAAVGRGRSVFQKLDCVHCHKPPEYTTADTYDVGLRDEAGMSRFNPPSLLGVSQLPAYFHDNRARSLRDVFVRYKHPEGHAIADRQLDDLLAFLESL